ncbi:2Fe-2S iron-sulfur cluster-binding protein [Bradyrhizobium sp.]|uniref:2Fe-2S iron-sulfur cluster-binding protein n=2 Tax=Nitrobacteraceae TaxID=41294 RepID=UPI00391C8102
MVPGDARQHGEPAETRSAWRLAEGGDGHSAHHPNSSDTGSAGAPMASPPSGGSAPAAVPSESNSGMMGMMGEMMGRPRKEFYPSLMEMPALSAERRRELESQARARIGAEIDGMANAEMALRHALASGKAIEADLASRQIREALNQVQSGVIVLRSLEEGKSPQQIAQNWFKSQMNLSQSERPSSDGVLGVSWFHVITMGLLAIVSFGMLAVYAVRMRRANALVDRLTRSPVAASGSMPAPVIPTADAPRAKATVAAAPAAGAAARIQETIAPAAATSAGGEPTKGRGLWKGKLKVCAIFNETPSSRTFRLQNPQGGAIPFEFLPGQFLTYSAQIDAKTVRRSYTIASSAAQTAYVETTIKREDGGVFSEYMHDEIKEGDLLDVMAPSGAFTFTGKEADSVVLIGGGVGITPLMAAIRYLFDISWPGEVYLVYGAQTTEQFIFRDELEYLQRRMNNLHVAATMARAAGTTWMGSEGQITAEFLARSVPDLSKRRVHLCGPPGMMQALKKTLVELGVPPEQVKSEAFGPALGAVPPPGRTVIESGESEIKGGTPSIGPATASIRFAKSGKAAPLPPDKSVLEVAESIGVSIDYSCRAGTCGICKTHLIEGSVTMEVQDALTEEDKAGGMILACQAKSVGNLVVEA